MAQMDQTLGHESIVGSEAPPSSFVFDGTISTSFIDGIRLMREELGPRYPLTANTTAHLVDAERRCTQESRANATHVLEKLVEDGSIERAGHLVIGGDYITTYDLRT
jgi:hypothetical protein